MKKCLVLPDSFKGTMTSIEVCDIMENRIINTFPDCEVITIPIADGGEGTVDSFLYALGGKKISVRVKGPNFEETDSFYGMIDKTAIIEMAAAAGLQKAGKDPNPAKTTTYGVGQLMEDAINRGCKNIVLGLGGSCTNDAGAGAAAALGTRFYHHSGELFIPTGETLNQISHIDISGTRDLLEGIELTAMCDIDNPLYGENGAAYVYAPQKGADEEMVKMLDEKLRQLSETILKSLKIDIGMKKGAGAAGGMGAGAEVFLGAKLKKGIDMILDMIRLEDILKNCNMIFTGEGRFDKQSLNGKVVMGIARRAKPMNVPVVVITGEIGEGIKPAYDLGISAIFSTNRKALPFDIVKQSCKSDLIASMDNVLGLIKEVENFSDRF